MKSHRKSQYPDVVEQFAAYVAKIPVGNGLRRSSISRDRCQRRS